MAIPGISYLRIMIIESGMTILNNNVGFIDRANAYKVLLGKLALYLDYRAKMFRG